MDKLFSNGLKAGFGSNSKFSSIERSGFKLTHTDINFGDSLYCDEWINGGGQELISTSDSQIYTRVYAGNCAANDILVSLNISEEDIMKFLKKIIIENPEQIRLSKLS